MGQIRSFIKDENAVGVVEIVLILVVLIGLVIIFKDQLGTLLGKLFKRVNSDATSL
ncbi:MAG: hypothetical protein IJM62_07520 [Lachnospiraceae bacterium]|nr:hypothetical protein [Lachnospiraceae bacterium]